MPELPEVQTVVNQLKESLVGKTITDVEIRLPKLFIGSKEKIPGSRITDVRRRAKMVIIDLEGSLSLVIHLKMTGQLIYSDSDGIASFPNPIPFAGSNLPGKTTHVIIHLEDSIAPPSAGLQNDKKKSTLFFNDMRQFGWIKVLNDDEIKDVDDKHGPDALGPDFTPEYLAKICGNWGRPVKLLLLEQSKIAGVGNIYANEALWYAGISPMKRGREVDRNTGIQALYDAIKKVLEMGIKYGGSSASDEAFVNAHGVGGHMQEHFVVYQKNGTSCPRCGAKIVRSKIGGRGTFFCPKCQN